MALEPLQNDIRELGEDDFTQLLSWLLHDERKRRAALPAVQAGQERLVQELRDSGVIPAHEVPEAPDSVDDFPEWESPINSNHTYLPGDMVRFEGKVWKSTYQGCNRETPGSWVAGEMWKDITNEILTPLAVHEFDDEDEQED